MKLPITIIFTLLFAFSVFAQSRAEVIVTSTYLRKAPDYSAEKIQTLQKGEKVSLEKAREASGWLYVSISDGAVKGWIRSNTIRAVNDTEKIDVKPQKSAQAPTKPAQNSTLKSDVPAPNGTTPNAAPTPSPTPEVPEVDNEVLRIETAEVNIYVRVVDGNNRPVNNLKEADFKVYEDGVLQPITSVTTAEVPIINALVIDNSRSLRAQLRKVIEAGKILVGTNKKADESSIFRFVSSDKIEVVQDFTTNKNALNDALDNLFVEGGQTAIIDAVYQAAKSIEQYQNSQKKEDVKLRALIVVSDGDDRGSKYNEQQLFELLRNSNVQIYTIGFVKDLSKEPDASGFSRQEKASSFLTRLARETGGKFYFPDSMDELPKIASDISGELRTQYLISYAPVSETYDGSFKEIKVVLSEGANKEKRTAITRTGRNSAPK